MIEKDVPVTDIDLDANIAIQTRVGIDPDVIERYREALHDRESVPRVVLFQDSTDRYWVADGHHRCRAQLAENSAIPIRAEVHEGEMTDALRYALKANAKHGLPRKANDLIKALRLAEDFDLVDPTDKLAVAEVLGCSNSQAKRLTRPARTKAKRDRNKKILELHAQGKSEREIAKEVGLSSGAVHRVLTSGQLSQSKQADNDPNEDVRERSYASQTEQDSQSDTTSHAGPGTDTASLEPVQHEQDGRTPIDAYRELAHEPPSTNANTPKLIEQDPWETLTTALATFMESCPDQSALAQRPAPESVQSLIAKVRGYLATADSAGVDEAIAGSRSVPPEAGRISARELCTIDKMLDKLTAGKPYTSAEAKAAFCDLDLKLLAAGKMTEAEAEHFLTYTLGV